MEIFLWLLGLYAYICLGAVVARWAKITDAVPLFCFLWPLVLLAALPCALYDQDFKVF